MLSLPDARQIFNLRQVKDVLRAGINELPVPDYLSDNIDRILTVTFEDYLTNEAFFWIIIDQILISAVYEKKPHADRTAASPITVRRSCSLGTAARDAVSTSGNLRGEYQAAKRICGLQSCHQFNYHRSQEDQLRRYMPWPVNSIHEGSACL